MIPNALHPLFWDNDVSVFQPLEHPDYTIFRVLEYGDDAGVAWLRETFNRSEIERVIRTERRLSPKSATFWALIYGIPESRLPRLSSKTHPIWRTHETQLSGIRRRSLPPRRRRYEPSATVPFCAGRILPAAPRSRCAWATGGRCPCGHSGTEVSFLGYPYPVLFPAASYLDVRLAHRRDIACMKVSATASRVPSAISSISTWRVNASAL
jgi:hypothetical protein